MRYRLRTLLILLAIGPPIVGWYVWPGIQQTYVAWKARQQKPMPGVILANRGRFTAINGATLVYRWNDQIRISLAQEAISRTEGKIAELEFQIAQFDAQSDEALIQLAELQSQLAQLQAQLEQRPKPLMLSRPMNTKPAPLINSPEVERAMLHDGMLIK